MKENRIHSLTGLRAAAMLTIFGCHLNYLADTPFQGFYSWIDNGRWGVNFFLTLSGFVLAFGYSAKLSTGNGIRDLAFVRKRISKIYIPYILTMILAVPLYIYQAVLSGGSFNVKLLIARLVINIGLIQSAIPFAKYSTSINEVSWFVSTICMIYLVTPAILRLNHRTAGHYTLFRLVFLIPVILVGHCCAYMVIRQIEYVRFADYGLRIIYRSPLIRIFPFLLGIVAYDIYCMRGNFRIRNGSFAEMLSIAVFFLWWMAADQTGLPTVATECVDMFLSMAVILVFAVSTDGIVSRLLRREKVIALGNISLDFYLIHRLVIQYGVIAAKHFRLEQGIAVLPLTVLFLAISLCGACLIHSAAKWLWAHLTKTTLR